MLHVKDDRSVPVQLHRLLLPNSLYALFLAAGNYPLDKPVTHRNRQKLNRRSGMR
jgi:hypothetical protein